MRNILEIIKSVFSWKPVHKGPPAYVYVYATGKDASNSEVNANDQVAILRRLSLFVSKKNSPVTIIFPGRPSKKIPDGAKQDGVQARFATMDQLEKIVKDSVSEFQKKHSVVLAAERSEFQRLADKLGIDYSFASTFAKTLDTVCGPIQRESKPQPPRRPPQPAKKEPHPEDGSTPEPAQPTAAEPVHSSDDAPPADITDAPLETHEQTENGNEPSSEIPVSKTPSSSRPKLYRHVPSQKRELTDRAILDLIDPL